MSGGRIRLRKKMSPKRMERDDRGGVGKRTMLPKARQALTWGSLWSIVSGITILKDLVKIFTKK